MKDGFFAMNNKEELPAKGLSVRFLVRMDDVTARINAKLNNIMSALMKEMPLLQQSTKPIQRKFRKWKIYSSSKRFL